MATYTQPDGDDTGAKYFQDVELSPENVASGALLERLDTRKYPKVGVTTSSAPSSVTLDASADDNGLVLTATVTLAGAPVDQGTVDFLADDVVIGTAPLRTADQSLDTLATAAVATATLHRATAADGADLTASAKGRFTDTTSAAVTAAAPAITSADNASTVHSAAMTDFDVTTTGTPDAVLTKTGALPTGVTFTDNGDGTATIAGTPGATTGAFPITITAHNGVTPDDTQTFTLTVT